MSRATGSLTIVALLLVLGVAHACVAADDCAAGPEADLIRQSPFAHGYLHGYEAGFHAGDADFHLARVRTLRELESNRLWGYQPAFGSRESFRDGFREGLVAGYQDSIAGRDFRGFQVLSAVTGSAHPQDFDRGFADGYKAGHTRGAGDLDADSDFDPGKGTCPAKPAGDGRLPESSAAYCAGYLHAHRLGYTDGYLIALPDGSPVLASR